MTNEHVRLWLLALLIGVLAAAGVFHGTQSGVGTLNDSAYYFSAAESLASGHGLRVEISPLDSPAWTDIFAAWPPLYPAILSIGIRVGLSVEGSARLWGLLSVLGMAVALFWLAYLLSGRWRVAAIGAALALTVRPVWQSLHYGLSEPLFMALSYVTLAAFSGLMIADITGTKKPQVLWVASLGFSLLMLARYLGGAFFVAGLSLLLWKRNREWRPAVIVLLSPLPLLTYLYRNWRLTGSLTDAQRAGYPSSLDAFARELLTGWWPDSPFGLGLSAAVKPASIGLVVGVAAVLLTLFVLRHRKKAQAALLLGNTLIPQATISTAKVIGEAALVYGGAVAVLSARGSIWPNDIGRLLIPVWPLMAVLLTGMASVIVQAPLQRIGIIVATGLLLIQVIGAVRFSQAAGDGLGFNAAPWSTSQALTLADDYVSKHHPPEQVALYSNFAPAVWLRTRTPVKRLDGALDGRKICASFSELPPGATEFALVLFSQVTPTVSDPFWRGKFKEQLSGCVADGLIFIPVADGLVVKGTLE